MRRSFGCGGPMWLVMLELLCVACRRESPPAVSTAPTSVESSPPVSSALAAPPGLARLDALLATPRAVAAPGSTLPPLSGRVMDMSTFGSVVSDGARIFAVRFGDGGDPSVLVAIEDEGPGAELGPVTTPCTVVVASETGAPQSTLLVTSAAGLTRHRPGAPPEPLHEGRLRGGVVDRPSGRFWTTECQSDDGDCAPIGFPLAGGPPRRLKYRAPVVHDLAVWSGRVVVAGRGRSLLEGVPLGDAELAEQVAWLQRGGAVPASARYAAGFIALLDPDGARPAELWPFPAQRPIGVATHDGALWVLTEGTLDRGLQDGALVRVDAAGEWSVRAQRLAMAEHLRFENGTPCWMEMPSGRFHFRCLSPAGAPTTLVDSDWNLFGATMTRGHVVWSVLTKGLHVAPVPEW